MLHYLQMVRIHSCWTRPVKAIRAELMGDGRPQLCLGHRVGGKPPEARQGEFEPFHRQIRPLPPPELRPLHPPPNRPYTSPSPVESGEIAGVVSSRGSLSNRASGEHGTREAI
jgi:hypothetical protein